MRKIFLRGTSVLFLFFSYPSVSQNDLNTVVNQLAEYQRETPAHKIFLSHDKPSYISGETIWFSSFLVDGAFHQLNALSNVVYVDLINPSGKAVVRRSLHSPLGISWGQMLLPDSLPPATYRLRAYTNYMKNSGDEYFYSKSIPVYDRSGNMESSSSTLSADIDLQFFAEGGNFLIGVENKLAFKAVGSNGLPVEVSGTIYDEQENEVIKFKSVHDGLGSITLTPAPGKKYVARFQDSSGRTKEVNLPEVLFSGYMLSVTREQDQLRLFVYRNITDGPNEIRILAQTRGITTFAAQGKIGNSSIVKIPVAKLPTGITQITIFDGNGVPVCERLVFINHGQQVKMNITTDKSTYGHRENVNVSVATTDPLKPEADTSEVFYTVSVFDKSSYPDYSNNMDDIVSYLFLASDLKGYIHSPGYYFKDNSMTTVEHADLLMMTQGWRRFTWPEILNREPGSDITYNHEKGVPLRGRITRALSKKPYVGGDIKILKANGGITTTESDEEGIFYNDDFVYFDSTELVIQTSSKSGNQSEYDLELFPPAAAAEVSVLPLPLTAKINDSFAQNAARQLEINEGYLTSQDVIMLDEVAIKEKRIKEEVVRYYGMADRTLTTKNLPKSSPNIIESIRGRFAGVLISGNSLAPTISIRGGGTPLFLLDGIQVDLYTILNIPPDQIESIDLIKGNNAAIFGSQGANGVFAFYTKSGFQDYTGPALGMNVKKYPGFSAVREFYHPRYDTESARNNLPDVRTTLFWSPLMKCAPDGSLSFDFFTTDVNSSYEIVLNAISLEGNPGAGTASFNVEE